MDDQYLLHNRITVRPLSALALSSPPLALLCLYRIFYRITQCNQKRQRTNSQTGDQNRHYPSPFTAMPPAGHRWRLLISGSRRCSGRSLFLFIFGVVSNRGSEEKAQKQKNIPQLTKKNVGDLSTHRFQLICTLGACHNKTSYDSKWTRKSGISCDEAMSQYGLIGGMVMPVIMFPSVLLSSVSTLLIPEISEKNVQHKNGQILHVLSRIFKITLLFSICISGIYLRLQTNLAWRYIIAYKLLLISEF